MDSTDNKTKTWPRNIRLAGEHILELLKESYAGSSFTGRYYTGKTNIGVKVGYVIKRKKGLLGKLFGECVVKIIDFGHTSEGPSVYVFDKELETLVHGAIAEYCKNARIFTK